MIKKVLLLILLLITALQCAADETDDCKDTLSGNNFTSVGDNRYITFDDAGIKGVCKNKFPSWGERMKIERSSTNAFDTTYFVKRNYCWFRDYLFHSGGCTSWGDGYSITFSSGDVKSANDASGSKTLRSSIGFWGHHICLKRFVHNEDLLQGGKNTQGRNLICGYVVNPGFGNECQDPMFGESWNSALIGCVEEPLKPSPPTYNVTFPASITPYIDPNIKLHDYTNGSQGVVKSYIAMGSTFDQPLIQLNNGSTVEGTLLLRYRFPGDTKKIDDIPQFGYFKSDENQLVYQAIITDDDPSKVCVCAAKDCDAQITIGCVDRPTPKDSNLKIISVIDSDNPANPTIYPRFVEVDGNGKAVYYDSDGHKVQKQSEGVFYKVDSEGNITNQPANGEIQYSGLNVLLDPKSPKSIGEYIIKKENSDKLTVYEKESLRSYGLEFSAFMPNVDSNGKPVFIPIDTATTRQQTDSCGAIKIADDLTSDAKPRFYIPTGSRDRTGCSCPIGVAKEKCTIQPETKCFNGTTQFNEPDAIKLYCPGSIINSSQVKNNNQICLQLDSPWQIMDYDYDEPCITIPTDCEARPEGLIAYGLAAWSKVAPGPSVPSTCNPAAGFEMLKTYSWSPSSPVSASAFGCKATDNDCNNSYKQDYLPKFAMANSILQQLQALANGLNRNLNDDEIDKINKSIGDQFKKYHVLAPPIQQTPKRSCNERTKYGLVENPCVFINSCSEITVATESSGYATWKSFKLNSDKLNQTTQPNVDVVEFAESISGICAEGYKQNDKSAPYRKCFMKYQNGKKVVEQWQDVINPCIIK